MDDHVKIISLNIRGLADRQKRRDVMNYLRLKKAAIICIQDIHIEDKKVNCMLGEWGLKGIIAPGKIIQETHAFF